MSDRQYGAIFDMDGVLVDSSEAHYESWRLLGKEMSAPFDRALFDATFGMTNSEIIPKWLGERAAEVDVEELSVYKEELYRKVAASVLRPLDGVVELLDSLTADGFGLAVGSSGPRPNVEMALGILGARDKFAALATVEEVTAGKPDPQVFVLAAKKLGLPPARCVVLEDAPQGVEAGRRAGARVLAVTSTRPASALADADVIVDSLRDTDAARLRALIDG